MKIGIEAQRIFRKKKHGMDYVVLEEIKQLQCMDKHNEYFIFVKPGPDHCLQSTFNCHVIEVKCPSYPLWEQYALPKAARHCGVDLLHCTSNTAPIWCDIPLVLTLHDIIFLEPRDKQNRSLYQNMGWVYRRLVVPRILKKCKQIITVSNYEKGNIMNKLGLPDNKVTMIYNGYNEWFTHVEDRNGVVDKYIADKDYFFFLGNTDPKKNSERTILAYANYLRQSEVKRRLLVADLNREEVDDILRRNGLSDIAGQIVTSGYIKNQDLPYIYSRAFAFLYTSLRESFGIPLLEGMACGTAVITSNTSSMPEIAGEDAALVNPEDIDNMASMMLRLERDEAYRMEIVQKGLQRVKMFSWRNTAERLLNVYVNC
ncbi:MAG: glycosyltransferase family 4 protein [Prevotella sp.]